MEAVAHNPSFAKKAGIPQSVGKDFSAADKGRKFGRGGMAATNKQNTQHGSMDMPFKSLKKFGGMQFGGKVKRYDGEEGSYVNSRPFSETKATEERTTTRDVPAEPSAPAKSSGSAGFRAAFAEARKDGEKTFDYDGKSYATDLRKPSKDYGDESARMLARSPRRETVTETIDTPAVTGRADKASKRMPSPEQKQGNTERLAQIAGTAMLFSPAGAVRGALTRGIMSKPVRAAFRAAAEGTAKQVSAKSAAKEAAYDARRASDMAAGFKKGGTMKYAKGGMAGGGMSPTAMAAMMARRRPRMGAGMPPVMPPAPMGMKKGGMANFEKSGKDAEKKGMKEGSKADMAMDKKQMMGMNMGGMTRKFGKGGMHKMPDGKMMKNSAMNMGGMAGMKKGGMPMKDGKPAFMMGKKMNMGGMAKYAGGGGIESRGKTKGTVIRMASGGSVSSASRRADGIAQRGKTRC